MRLLPILLIAALTSAAADLTGTWSGSMRLTGADGTTNDMPAYLSLRQDGTSLAGKVGRTEQDSGPIQAVTLESGGLSFELAMRNGGVARFKLRIVSEAALAGTVTLSGAAAFTGAVELKRGSATPAAPEETAAVRATAISPYDDVRFVKGMPARKDIRQLDLSKAAEILPTLGFNQKTPWPGPDRMPPSPKPDDLLTAAMNPGLGIRQLHAQGITGKGVSVAIIDQPLYRDHPEFAGKIAAYEDVGTNSEASMHGPSVASLLVGTKIGTAPDARLYFVAVPSWLGDAANEVKALEWIVAQNRKLPAAERIRVVSLSAAPSGPGTPFKKNTDLWDGAVQKAEAEGILVLDCTQHRGLTRPCWFQGPDREDPASCVPGFPGIPKRFDDTSHLFCPSSPRTTAEEYEKGDFGYAHWGRGGASWAPPYAAGVLALGWQIRPEMTAKEAQNLLLESAWKTASGAHIINPPEFIRMVKESKR